MRVADLKPCARSGAPKPVEMAHPIVRMPRRRTRVQPPGRGLRAASISTGHSACLPLRAHPLHLLQRAVARARLDGSSFRHARRQVRAATHPPAPPGGSRGGPPPDPLLPPRRARRTAAEPPLRRGIELAPPDAVVVPVRLAHRRNTALDSARASVAPHSRRDEAGTPAGGVAHGEAAAIRSRTCGNASQRRGAPRRPANAWRRVKRRASHRPAARRQTPPDAVRAARLRRTWRKAEPCKTRRRSRVSAVAHRARSSAFGEKRAAAQASMPGVARAGRTGLTSVRPACGHSLARGSRGVASGPMGAHPGGEANPRKTSPSTGRCSRDCAHWRA